MKGKNQLMWGGAILLSFVLTACGAESETGELEKSPSQTFRD
jgi:hypothetical protein